MRNRSPRTQLFVPRYCLMLAGAVAVLTVAVAIGVAAVRWAHHVAALFEIAAIVVAALLVVAIVSRILLGGIGAPTIVELDLEEPLEETAAPGSPLALRALAGARKQTLREVIETLERASRDQRVVALFARVGRPAGGLGQIQELRDAVIAFRASGKRAVAFSETFGEFSPGNGSYYLASAFDEISLQPSGDLNLTGLMASVTFVRGALDKAGVVPRLDHRREYKTAMNLLTETGFTPAHRESVEQVTRSQFGQIVRGISETRNIPEAEVARLIDQGPFLGPAAHEARLVDRLGYRDQVIASLKAETGVDARLLYLSVYARRTRRASRKGDTVALVMGVGGIRRGKSGGLNPLDQGRPYLGSATLATAIRAAVDDRKVRAILFRVDSPGGSYVASDTVWRETVRAGEAGKPVIVSMGNVAGSGGYFVAMAADKIVASPGTITGSIGVLGGKAVTAGLRARFGLSADEVHTSSHAGMWNDAMDYSPEEWDKVQAFLDRVYEDFTSKAAAGRGLTLESVQEVAKGRIWTGEDARRVGLVDELGGYATALSLVRQAIGRTAEAPLRIKLFPPPASPLGRLRRGRSESSDDLSGADSMSTVCTLDLAHLGRPLTALAAALGIGPASVVAMPTHEVSL
jgi:protease-4